MPHAGGRWRRHLASAALLSLVWLAATPRVDATTLRKMDLAELVVQADRVVYVRTVGSSVYWDPTGTQIYTDTTFEVLTEAKGQGGPTVTVSMLGGRIDPLEMREDGTPAFTLGEEVVLFTLDRVDGRSDLVGFCQGVMRVQPELETGEKFAVAEVPLGVTLVGPGEPQQTTGRSSVLRAPLAALLEEVQQIVAGSRPPGPVIATSPDTDLLEVEGGNP
ncbi:MAG TPA: hypothetical protein VFG76_05935 [Candidatus Polarisedimenticolia bacterium]|nr:hypothetical protein [Candidatus Polarisedimenticolia bacterium]